MVKKKFVRAADKHLIGYPRGVAKKPARRCRTTSTWDHAAFTASRFTTIWFLRLTNELPSSSATTSKTTRTIRAFFISASNQLNLRMRILHAPPFRSEEHTSELQSQSNLVC